MKKITIVSMLLCLLLSACSTDPSPALPQKSPQTGSSTFQLTGIALPVPYAAESEWPLEQTTLPAEKQAGASQIIFTFNKPVAPKQPLTLLWIQMGKATIPELSYTLGIDRNQVTVMFNEGIPQWLNGVTFPDVWKSADGESLNKEVHMLIHASEHHPLRTLGYGEKNPYRIVRSNWKDDGKTFGFLNKSTGFSAPADNGELSIAFGEMVEISGESNGNYQIKLLERDPKLDVSKTNILPGENVFQAPYVIEKMIDVPKEWITTIAEPSDADSVVSVALAPGYEDEMIPKLSVLTQQLSGYSTFINEMSVPVTTEMLDSMAMLGMFYWPSFVSGSADWMGTTRSRTSRDTHKPEVDFSKEMVDYYLRSLSMHESAVLRKFDRIQFPAEGQKWKAGIREQIQRNAEIQRLYVNWGHSGQLQDMKWFFDRLNDRYPDESRKKAVETILNHPDASTERSGDLYADAMRMYTERPSDQVIIDEINAYYEKSVEPIVGTTDESIGTTSEEE